MRHQKLLSLGVALTAALAGSAQAATWGYGQTTGTCYTGTSTSSTSTANLTSANNVNTSGSCLSSATGTGALTAGTAAISGWSSTGTNGNWSAASLSDQGSSSGLGVVNRTYSGSGDNESSTGGGHAIDNSTNIDGVLFSFQKSTILNQLRVGWSGSDGDLTVMYYTGSATTAAGAMASWGKNGLGTGWNLLKHYDVAGNISSPDYDLNLNNSGAKSSSFWLITAYNSAFGSTGAWSTGADAFKLLSVSGTTASVSEPGALALVGLAMLGGVAARRQRRKSA